MTAFLLRRALHALLVILAVSILVFGLLHLAGDPTTALLPMEATAADVARLRAQLGLDRPLPEQYLRFLARALQGDFGFSFRYRQAALSIVMERMPATLQLAGAALLVSLLVSIPAGSLAALKRGTWLDQLATLVAVLGQSIPSFWLGLMLILVAAVNLRWLPASGAGEFRHLVLPALTLGLSMAAITARLLRSALLEVLSKDYIRTARAKGLAERVVVLRHAFRNAAIPVVTVLALQMGTLLSGAVITETVFSYPGMGLLVIQSITGKDFPVVQAFVFCFTLLIVVLNLLMDLLYARIDPRIVYR